MEFLGEMTLALVQRNLVVLVGDRDKSTGVDEVLGDRRVSPKARVVKGRVPVLVDGVDVRLVPQKLAKEK
jgi:hypothetical protein